MTNTVKVERAKLDITQDELARSIKVSRHTILSIERGRFTPSVVTALKIAQYFNLRIEDIFLLESND